MSEEFEPTQAQFYAGTPLERRETTYTEQKVLTDLIYGEDHDVEVEIYEDGAVLDYDDAQEQLGARWYALDGVDHLIVSDSEKGLRATINAHLEENRADPISSDDWGKPLGGTASPY